MRMKSLSVVIPLFNRDRDVVDYVVRDMLQQDIDEIVIANTGEKRLNFGHPNVIEVWQPLHKWLPGITRNMGAVVANGGVQVHSGVDLITASGSWSQFRALDDRMSASASCGLLNPTQTKEALAGKRVFKVSFNPGCRAVFGLTKRAALLRLKGPFDWEMIGWGWVDVDLKHGVRRIGLTHREFTSLKVLHLDHKDGSSNWHQSSQQPNFRQNRQLVDAKNQQGTRGWWSGMITKERGEVDMGTRTSEDCQVCGELDFHTVLDSVAYLKSKFESLEPGGRIFVTFNDMDKLGPKWPAAFPRNSHGRVRKTFWTLAMMSRALQDAGFEQVAPSDRHIGRVVPGISTLTAIKPMPPIDTKVVETPEPESQDKAPASAEAMADTSVPKRGRGRPRRNR